MVSDIRAMRYALCALRFDLESLSYIKFRFLAVVPLFNGSQIPHDSGVDFRLFIANAASFMFAIQVSVGWTYTEGGSEGEIWEAVIGDDLSNQPLYGRHIADRFPEIYVKYGPTRVFRLQVIL
jgi:hypothetical protein